MRKILTNLERETHFVLTDDDSRILGIVKVPSGEQDITEKVLTAVEDDRTAKDLIIQDGTKWDFDLKKDVPVTGDILIKQENVSDVIRFDIEMEDEDEDERYTMEFSLDTSEVY